MEPPEFCERFVEATGKEAGLFSIIIIFWHMPRFQQYVLTGKVPYRVRSRPDIGAFSVT
jgi:hypothetical protein